MTENLLEIVSNVPSNLVVHIVKIVAAMNLVSSHLSIPLFLFNLGSSVAALR